MHLCRLGGDGNVLDCHTLVHKQRQKFSEVHSVQMRVPVELLC